MRIKIMMALSCFCLSMPVMCAAEKGCDSIEYDLLKFVHPELQRLVDECAREKPEVSAYSMTIERWRYEGAIVFLLEMSSVYKSPDGRYVPSRSILLGDNVVRGVAMSNGKIFQVFSNSCLVGLFKSDGKIKIVEGDKKSQSVKENENALYVLLVREDKAILLDKGSYYVTVP